MWIQQKKEETVAEEKKESASAADEEDETWSDWMPQPVQSKEEEAEVPARGLGHGWTSNGNGLLAARGSSGRSKEMAGAKREGVCQRHTSRTSTIGTLVPITPGTPGMGIREKRNVADVFSNKCLKLCR